VPDENNWTISKVINVGDLVAIVVALTSLAAVYASLNSRVAVLESGATRAINDVSEIKGDLKELNRKLEQLLMMRIAEHHAEREVKEAQERSRSK
jgi:hypothetical protein